MKYILLLLVFFTTGNTVTASLSEDLTNAIMDDEKSEAKRLIEKGADINGKDLAASAPLFWAIEFRYVEMIEILIKYCPDPTAAKIYTRRKRGVNCTLTAAGKQLCNIQEAAERTGNVKMIGIVKNYMRHGCGKCLVGERSILNNTYRLLPTDRGGVVYIECPVNSGSCTWRCDNNSQWEEKPDLSQCHNVQNIFRPSNETVSIPAADNITRVADNIKDKILLPGDVLTICQGLNSLQKQYKETDTQESDSEAPSRSKKYLCALMNITDKVLGEPQIWGLMPKETVKNISTFQQKSIVEAALTAAKYITPNTESRYSTKNIDVLVISQSKDYYKLEENRVYKDIFLGETHIRLPENFYKNYISSNGSEGSDNEDQIVVAFTSYGNLQCQTNDIPCEPSSTNGIPINITGNTQVNSVVIGANIGYGPKWKAESDGYVELKFNHIYHGSIYELKNPMCVWWDTENNSWFSDGCELYSFTNTFTESYTICHCDHVTNLAVIMDINGILDNDTRHLRSIIDTILEETMGKDISNSQPESIVNAALEAAKYIASNKTITYSRENIEIRLVSQPKDYYEKPENRIYKDPGFGETYIRLPENFYKNYTSINDVEGSDKKSQIVVVFTSYKDLHCQTNVIPCVPLDVNGTPSDITAKAHINSVVLGATVGYGSKWYAESNEYVELKFGHIYKGSTYKLENPECVWWDTENNSWSSGGCELYTFTESYTTCHCVHLTNLAVIMDINTIDNDTDLLPRDEISDNETTPSPGPSGISRSPSPMLTLIYNIFNPAPSRTPSSTGKGSKRKCDDADDVIKEAMHQLQALSSTENISDDCSDFAKVVANDLRTMTAEKRLFAQKMISDVLYLGKLGKISFSSKVLE